jgi:hypothetical protein
MRGDNLVQLPNLAARLRWLDIERRCGLFAEQTLRL